MEDIMDCTENMRTSEQKSMAKVTTYTIDGKRFVVTPVFRNEGYDSLSSILMRMMKSELSNLC